MLPIQEIYNRIIWDTRLNEDIFIMGFQERTSETGIGEKCITQWSVNGDIPWHRVRYVRCRGMMVWDRKTHLDLFSTGNLPNFAWKSEDNSNSLNSQNQNSENQNSQNQNSQNQNTERLLEVELKVEAVKFKSRSVYKYSDSIWEEVDHLPESFRLQSKLQNPLKTLSIASFNVLYDLFEADKIQTSKRIPAIFQHLRECDADIIAIQEATPDFVKLLLSESWVRGSQEPVMGNGYYISESTDAKNAKPYGNLLMSRLPFTLLEHRLSAQKRLMVGCFQVNNQLLQVGVVHLTSDHSQNAAEKRKYQLTALLRFLKTQSGSSLIVGDFNTRGNQLEEILQDYNFVDLWEELHPDEPGYTFDPESNPLAELMSLQGKPARLDRILLNSLNHHFKADSISLFAYEAIPNTDEDKKGDENADKNRELYPSDHFGIRAVIKTPNSYPNEEKQNLVSLTSLKSIPPTYRSAIFIIPPLDVLPAIQDIRRLYDARYERWMPHINLIYGFLPDSYFAEAVEVISPILSEIEAFEITLNNFQTFNHRKSSTVWLHPQTKPERALQKLQTALQNLFPQCNEQSKKSNAGFTPHLSVGQFLRQSPNPTEVPTELSIKLSEWRPVSFTVSSIALISRPGDEPFEIRQIIPLGEASTKKVYNTKISQESDSQINTELIKLVNRLEPELTPEQKVQRQTVIEIVKQACTECLGKIANLHLLGSERLGVSTADSDLDAVCEIPNYLSGEAFLKNVEQHLQGLCDFTQLVTDARVPLLRLQLEKISVDLLYAQVADTQVESEPRNSILKDETRNRIKPDSPSFKAIVGCWEADAIAQTVEKYIPLSSFILLLRAVRAWAKSRCLYSNTYGFLGGFSYALLAAWSCQSFQVNNSDINTNLTNKISLEKLISNFFQLLSKHDWSQPISLTDTGIEYKVKLPNDLMPVITSISPVQNTARNVTKSTLNILSHEFKRGAQISSKAIAGKGDWDLLFETPNINLDFNKLIKLEISCHNQKNLESCLNLLESHIVGLVIELEKLGVFVRPHTEREILQNTEYTKLGVIKLSINTPPNLDIKLVEEISDRLQRVLMHHRFISQFDHSSPTFSIKHYIS
ncbi:MAG: poly(A) polymerase [Mastigocoleus sp.]